MIHLLLGVRWHEQPLRDDAGQLSQNFVPCCGQQSLPEVRQQQARLFVGLGRGGTGCMFCLLAQSRGVSDSIQPTLEVLGWRLWAISLSADKLSSERQSVCTFWDGKQFLSRLGNLFHAPEWFLAGLPNEPLDGELWLGRKKFQRTVSIVRRQDQSDFWKEVRYVVFDAPKLEKGFEERLEFIHEVIRGNKPLYAQAHEQQLCMG